MNLNQQSKNNTTVRPRDVFNSRIVENFMLVWLDPRIDEMNENEFRKTITELQRFVNTIKTFINADECIDFVTNNTEEKFLMIISDELASNTVPMTYNIPQIIAFYIFCRNESENNKRWKQQWPKVQKVSTVIGDICEALKQDVQKCERDSMPISFLSVSHDELNKNLDQLDPKFMYTRILKDILLKINFNEEHMKEFIKYYRKNFADNLIQLNNIDELEKDYKKHSPIHWYTYGCCIYPVLNRALRLMEVDTIIKMGFFIHDLHNEIEKLHSEQYNQQSQPEKFIIYRGQSLSKTDFDRMEATQGGLISFNTFLSTTKDLSVALSFARSSLASLDLVGIIFVMTIDPSIKSTHFASIGDVSHYKTEEEILFSMHTVFRIDNIIESPDDNRLWQVDLIQTKDNDSQLNALTKRIRQEIHGPNEWDKLGNLLIKLGEFKKADELYQVLLDQADTDREKIHLYHQLGWNTKKQKQYKEAIVYYEKSLQMKQDLKKVDLHSIATSLNEIGSVYEKMDEYSKALLYYEQALGMMKTLSSPDRSRMTSSYSKIGSVYEKMGEYDKALLFHEKALEIRRGIDPLDKVKLAYCYNNIGFVHKNMGNFSQAILAYEKALENRKEALPENHYDLADSCSRISFVYDEMGEKDKALEYSKQAIDIGQRSLPDNHPQLKIWRKNLRYKNKNRK